MRLTRSGAWVLAALISGTCLVNPAFGAERSADRRGSAASIAVTSVASPATGISRVFDLRGLSADKRDIAKETLLAHDFDWNLLLPALKSSDKRKRIPISVTDASEWGAVGLAWPAPVGKIEVDDDILDPQWFRDIVLHEVGHMVDFYYLQPNSLRGDVAELYGKPWDEVGHSFNAAFTQGFSTYAAVDSAYPLGAQQILELRELMGFSGPPPLKTGELTDVREFDPDFSVAKPAEHDRTNPYPVGPVA